MEEDINSFIQLRSSSGLLSSKARRKGGGSSISRANLIKCRALQGAHLRLKEKESAVRQSSFMDEDLSPIKQAGQHTRLHMESIEVSHMEGGSSRVQQRVEVEEAGQASEYSIGSGGNSNNSGLAQAHSYDLDLLHQRIERAEKRADDAATREADSFADAAQRIAELEAQLKMSELNNLRIV